MVVGTVMVFIVLLLVVWLGNLIIAFVNRFVPEEVKQVYTSTKQSAIDSKTYAVISSTVSKVTGGKGTVVDIKKI